MGPSRTDLCGGDIAESVGGDIVAASRIAKMVCIPKSRKVSVGSKAGLGDQPGTFIRLPTC